MSGTAKSASEGYGPNEPIHFRKRTKTLFLAIQRARGVAIVRKTASTVKYTVARTKTATFKIRFTKIPHASLPPPTKLIERFATTGRTERTSVPRQHL